MLRYLLVLVLAVPGTTRAQDTDLTETDLTEWERVEAGKDTGCAFGTPYSFFYHPGTDTSRLLIYFQGGGGLLGLGKLLRDV
jgi:hypothetical protein